jgi:hypothetical protein
MCMTGFGVFFRTRDEACGKIGSKLSQNDIGYKSSSASTVHATNETPSNDEDQFHSLGDGLYENSSSDSSTTSRLIPQTGSPHCNTFTTSQLEFLDLPKQKLELQA